MYLFFIWYLDWLWCRQIHYSNHWKRWALKIETFLGLKGQRANTPSNSLSKGSCPHQNHYIPRKINNRYINSYTPWVPICLTSTVSRDHHSLVTLVSTESMLEFILYVHYNHTPKFHSPSGGASKLFLSSQIANLQIPALRNCKSANFS